MKNTLLGLVIVLLGMGCALEGDHVLPTYTIIYQPNGGTGTMEDSTHVFGTEKKLNVNKFARLNNGFSGWGTTDNGPVVYRDKASVKNLTKTDGETITLYAQWEPGYYVVYHPNGGTGNMEKSTFIAGADQELSSNIFARKCFTFAGWSKSVNGPVEYANQAMVKDLELVGQTVTLYAKWKLNLEMVAISGGTFTMGSNCSQDWSASPPHQVTLTKGFYMGKYEITQEQYQAVMGSLPASLTSNNYGVGDNFPVYYVSWYDAIEFCNKLSEIEGLSLAYTINGTDVTQNDSAAGYRLPTEAQWEYARRAGTPTEWSFEDTETNIGNYAWYDSNSGGKTHEVGKKLPNAWGLYDMPGNVGEWCWDWHGNYSEGPQTDDPPVGPDTGSWRVWRGGSFYHDSNTLRFAYRSRFEPYNVNSGLGFRVVRSK